MKKALVACLLVTVPVVFAANDRFPDIDIPFQKYVLPNGLTLIVHEDHKAPLVAVNVVYKVGSRDERPGRSGFAHLFEHLMFNGSEHNNEEYFRALTAIGATNINGMTTDDFTVYFETVPTPALDRILWLESDRMGHLLPAVDQKKLDEQRGVVQNEKRENENAPYGKVEEILAANTYPPSHPYSWTTIGSMQDLNAASLQDVQDWFHAYYGAANTILTIAGDVSATDVKTRVEHYFGDIPAGPPLKRTQLWIAKTSGQKRVVMQDNVSQPQLQKVWNAPPAGTRDATLLMLAAFALETDREVGRLFDRLVHVDRSATMVAVDVNMRDLGSQFGITAFVNSGSDTAAVEQSVDSELAGFLRTGPTRMELDRAKTGMYSSYARLQSVASKGSILTKGELWTGSPAFYKQFLEWVHEATPTDVRDAARRWLSDGEFVMEVQPLAKHSLAATGPDRTLMPPVSQLPELNLPPLQRITLSNGLNVALAERHTAPVVQLTLIADAGFAADDAGKAGTAQLTMALLDKGTTTRDAAAILRRSRELDARIGAGASLDSCFVNLSALQGRLDASLELFADIVLHPAFPQTNLQILKQQTLASIEQDKSAPGGIVSRLMPRLVYGERHPYSNPLSGDGSPESLAALNTDELKSFYNRWIRPDTSTLLIVGDTTLQQIVPLLERRFKDWRTPASPRPQKTLAAVTTQQKARVFLVDRPGAEQTQIVAASVAPSNLEPERTALQGANIILGGHFLSRLNLNLREDKHWSYGVSSQWQGNKGPGLFMINAPVQTEQTAAAMSEILRELRAFLGSRPPDEAEIVTARNALVQSLPAGAETVEGVASFFSSIVNFGFPDDYWNTFVSHSNVLTPQQVESAAHKLVNPEGLTWLLVGDLAKIEADVRGLNLGDLHVLDVEGQVIH